MSPLAARPYARRPDIATQASRRLFAVLGLALAMLWPLGPAAADWRDSPASASRKAVRDGEAEARLLEVYSLMGNAQMRDALTQAEALVREHPNFQLAQLVLGDLLAAQARPSRMSGEIPTVSSASGLATLTELREEASLRLRAQRERPPPGALPTQFLNLSPRNRHAIAIDTSRARLYLFENTGGRPRLVADYYISIGKSGIEKAFEGDLRTPVGVYFITGSMGRGALRDFYGSGALPINYPNPLDMLRGKTGSGIWLHGTPPNQFARPPKASDGCVVLANPDLERIMQTVQPRTTPVVIAPSLQWVQPNALQQEQAAFDRTLRAWHKARVSGDPARVLAFYSDRFSRDGKPFEASMPLIERDVQRAARRNPELQDLSYLHWKDSSETMVVTFSEVSPSGHTRSRRQYWVRMQGQWKIFYEGVIS